MSDIKKVTIGIQARTTSQRFPSKVLQEIGGRPMLDHVIEACQESAEYLNRYSDKNKYFVEVALCAPTGDQDLARYRYTKDIPCVWGSENDVLSRYASLAQHFSSDYIVRITADCPLIPSFIISKHIMIATANRYDYLSNVHEKCRTTVDGWDCEVISRKLLEYTNKQAKMLSDREHVTTYIRREKPAWAKMGGVVNFLDLSWMKISVDTPHDLEIVRKEYEKIDNAVKKAEEIYGKQSVHRV